MKKQPLNPAKRGPHLAIDQLIDNFSQYLLGVRGLALTTVITYCKHIKYFLRTQFKGNRVKLSGIHPKGINQFLVDDSHKHSFSHTQSFTYSLRSFFRFLKQTNLIKEDLAMYVPSVANRKKQPYPQTLSPEEIKTLLESCDKQNVDGLRDYAILMLMANLGLRSSEVCSLCLNDLDWDKGEISVRGKGVESRLPLLKEVGKALVSYLKHGRPVCKCEKVFIRSKIILEGLTRSYLGRIFRSALTRAGLHPQKKGPHLLRHSFAMQLLNQKASFEEIGMILRHKGIRSTAIYARSNFDKLRTIALPWPKNVKKERIHG